MTEILIFNRRRPLEVEMLKIQDFEKRHNVQQGTPAYDTLTPAEKIICGRYMRVEARGKLHLKPAAMLLSLKQVSLINLIYFKSETRSWSFRVKSICVWL